MGIAEDITAVILAGGRARRMGGRDKGLIPLAGRPLIAHVLAALQPQLQHLIISANRHQQQYAALGYPVYADTLPDHPGPLAGILSAMGHARTPYILTVPCDGPLPSPELAVRLYQALRSTGQRAALAHDGERYQPLYALLDCALEEALREALQAGERRPETWLLAQGAVTVDFADCPEMFLNINDPQALARLETLLRVRQPGCQDPDAEPSMLQVDDAVARILAALTPVSGAETLPLREALDRVLLNPVHAPVAVPSGTNSAMDGYALMAAALTPDGQATLQLAGTAYAGHPYTDTLQPGQCVRITTGALLPSGADMVVIQEHTKRHDEHIQIATDAQAGENIREAGEDIRCGQMVLPGGCRLGAAELGLLASLGIAEVEVRRPLRVTILSTGDELVPVGSPLQPGMIHDSNRYTLYGMLQRACTRIEDLGIIRDREADLQVALQQAAVQADVILSSGGVSVGDTDLVREMLSQLGSVHFWKIAMKPGRPLAFGRIGKAWFFGLPGNPVSVMVTFQQIVAPALARLRGEQPSTPLRLAAVCQSRLHKRAGRTEYQRGVLSGSDTALVVHKTGAQGSGILSSMGTANCYIVLPTATTTVEPGTVVGVEPFTVRLRSG